MIGRQTLLWRLAAVAALATASWAADNQPLPPTVPAASSAGEPPAASNASGTAVVAVVADPAASPAPAPAAVSGARSRRRTAGDLEKLLAPIALYPDPLLAAVLTASAYPLEVVQAARFVKDTNNLAKLEEQPWDENVKTVARFSTVIEKMSQELAWTVDVGQAFVAQQMDVMDTVQALRAKAQATGALHSTPEQNVTVTNQVAQQPAVPEPVYVTNQVVQILPADPAVVYVPQYDPALVYYAPVYAYDPWVPLITFGFGVACGPWFWSDCYWHGGYVVYRGWGCYPYGYTHHGRGHGHPYPPHGGYSPHASRYPGSPPHGSGAPMPPRDGASRSSPQPIGGNLQTASARPWQPDASRLQNSFDRSRTGARAIAPSLSGTQGGSAQRDARPGSTASALGAPQSRLAPTAAAARTTPSPIASPRDRSALAAPASVPSAGTSPRMSFAPSRGGVAPRASLPSSAAVRGAPGTWRSGSTSLPATRYGAPGSFSPRSPVGRAAPSAPSFSSRGAGRSYGGSVSRPSFGGSFSRGGGGFSAPRSGGGSFSGGGSRGGRR
ncbi:MAG: DUF3300 domain-containing protein [Verrucomicrobia bacterium]|nr:DUF3300 domain-containing protein [Verrucomicrobiota bacterium]